MACLDMYNNQNNERSSSSKGGGLGAPPIMSPRISFSNDFVESSSSSSHSQSHHLQQQQMMMRAYRDAPVSSDFEFSVSNYSMLSADELFSKGKLLPFKESYGGGNQMHHHKTTTLRDELLAGDEDDSDFSSKPPKSSTRWKGFLGLRKSPLGSRKVDKSEGSVLERSNVPTYEDLHATKNSQDSNARDFEFRL